MVCEASTIERHTCGCSRYRCAGTRRDEEPVGRSGARRARNIHDDPRCIDRQHQPALDRPDISHADRQCRRMGDHRLLDRHRGHTLDVRPPLGSPWPQARVGSRPRDLHARVDFLRCRWLPPAAHRRPRLSGPRRRAHLRPELRDDHRRLLRRRSRTGPRAQRGGLRDRHERGTDARRADHRAPHLAVDLLSQCSPRRSGPGGGPPCAALFRHPHAGAPRCARRSMPRYGTRAADRDFVVRPGVGLDVAAAAGVPGRGARRASGSRCHRGARALSDLRSRAVARPRPRVGPWQPDARHAGAVRRQFHAAVLL